MKRSINPKLLAYIFLASRNIFSVNKQYYNLWKDLAKSKCSLLLGDYIKKSDIQNPNASDFETLLDFFTLQVEKDYLSNKISLSDFVKFRARLFKKLKNYKKLSLDDLLDLENRYLGYKLGYYLDSGDIKSLPESERLNLLSCAAYLNWGVLYPIGFVRNFIDEISAVEVKDYVSNFKNLKILSIFGNSPLEIFSNFTEFELAHISNLEKLQIKLSPSSWGKLAILKNFEVLKNLVALEISGSENWRGGHFVFLADSNKLANLKKLKLCNLRFKSIPEFIFDIPNLKYLKISDKSLKYEFIKCQISKLSSTTQFLIKTGDRSGLSVQYKNGLIIGGLK